MAETERVLHVEDEHQIRYLLDDFAEEFHYTVSQKS